MGGTSSRPPEDVVTGRPRGFYLVFGKPRILFTGERIKGPFIYDVEQNYDDDANLVEHTETYDLSCSVPKNQKFALTTKSAAAEPRFTLEYQITFTQPVQRVQVLAGVQIKYIRGTGIRLSQAPKSQHPFLLHEARSLPVSEDHLRVFTTLEPLVGKLLSPAASDEGGTLQFAPVAIVVEMAPEQLPSGKRTSPATLFAFLDVPEPFLSWSGEGDAPPFNCKLVKQFLQIGRQVYELNDVFDLAADDVSGDENEENEMCVICMFSPKDTTILPCRHMCTCYECAGQLRLGTNKCPICRTEIQRLIKL